MDLASPKINQPVQINGGVVPYGTRPAVYDLPVRAGDQKSKEF